MYNPEQKSVGIKNIEITESFYKDYSIITWNKDFASSNSWQNF